MSVWWLQRPKLSLDDKSNIVNRRAFSIDRDWGSGEKPCSSRFPTRERHSPFYFRNTPFEQLPVLQDIRWLVANTRCYWRLYTFSVSCTVLSGTIGLIDPLLMKWVIDRLIPAGKINLLVLAGALFLLGYALRMGLGVLGANLGTQAAQRVVVRLRLRALRNLQRQSSSYHENISPGESLFRLEQDVEQIGQSGDELFLSSFQSSVFLVLNCVAMFILNASLALAVLPLIPIFTIIRHLYHRRARLLSHRVQNTSAARSVFFQEELAAIVQSQLLNNEGVQARRFLRLARHAMSAQLTRRRAEMLYGGLSLLIIGVGVGAMLACGGYQVATGALTVGGLVAFWGYLIRLFEPVAGLVELDTKFQRIRASIGRIREVLQARSAVESPVPSINLSSRHPAIVQFKNVSFAYGDGRVGVREMSFILDAGEKVAIVGKTGSGKSTVTKLIARLYDLDEGSIEVDGHDIRRLALRSLRSSLLLVPQEAMLFQGSFRDNLICGCSNITPRELEDAVELTQLDAMLHAWPEGWDEQLGPRATKLSGGERQRLALARALLRKPRMLILDETTSALDSVTEERILGNLDALADRMTFVFVTHNPIVMKWADRVLMIADGYLADEGPHHQLTLRSRTYQRMCETDRAIIKRQDSRSLLSTNC
jgi:ABC-type multidrug transport system fused ATPase/permease subunit